MIMLRRTLSRLLARTAIAGALITHSHAQTYPGQAQCFNMQLPPFSAMGNNSTDTSGALSAALTGLSTGTGGCIYFPPGKYKFNSQPSFTFPAGVFSLTIVGGGADSTILTWPNGSGGIALALSSAQHSAHVRDLSLTTSQAGGGTALSMVNSVQLGNFPGSDVTRVFIGGEDRTGLTNWWNTGINDQVVSGLTVSGVTIFGPSGGASGVGINLTGTAGPLALIVPHITGTNFFSVGTGITIGTQVQGVVVDGNSNFTNGTTGIQVAASGANLVQLVVANSQFNVLGTAISRLSAMADSTFTGNLFFVPANNAGIAGLNNQDTIIGNNFSGIGGSPPAASIGVSLGTTSVGAKNIIANNVFNTLVNAVAHGAGSSGTNIDGNSMISVTTPITNITQANRITNNDGYNPPSVALNQTYPVASTATYTAGPSPETNYIVGGTVTAIKIPNNAGSTIYNDTSVPRVVELGPGETMSITYTAAPTQVRTIH